MTPASGIRIDELDPGIRPQDDLFRHVNGRWLARAEIPADRAAYGPGQILSDEAEMAVRDIVEGAGSRQKAVRTGSSAFMDAGHACAPDEATVAVAPG